MDITIHHNPDRGTSRNTLGMIRNAGIELRPYPGRLRLCRPSEIVLEILLAAQQGAFTKEDGERVIDDKGSRIK
jgi:hypothetical protein